jgi:O-acetyl-ADP-ribose deacetylase (regulator of RNase III)
VADFNLDRVRQAAAWAARKARDLGCKSVATVAHGAGTGQIDPAWAQARSKAHCWAYTNGRTSPCVRERPDRVVDLANLTNKFAG